MGTLRAAAMLAMAGTLALAACAGPSVPTVEDPRPLVVDLDMDSSDVMALAYVAGLPNYELVGVTVPGTGVAHCPQGATNAQRLLAELKMGDVPVGCGDESPVGGGHPFPDGWRLPSDAMYGVRLAADGDEATPQDAVSLLADAVAGADEPVDILTLGPLTNVARALEADPGLAEGIGRVVMMAGAFEVPGNVNDPTTGSPEWNVWADPGAVAAVLDSGVPVVLVPLDATDDVPIDGRFFGQLSSDHGAAAADVTYELLVRNGFLVNGNQFFWDPLAAAFLEDPEVVEVRGMRVRVGTDEGAELGRTIADGDGTEVQVAVSASRDRFVTAFLAGLRRGADRASGFSPAGPLSVSYDGSRCTVAGAFDLHAGPLRVGFSNRTDSDAGVAIISPRPGATWQDVEEFVASYEVGTPNPDFVDLLVPGFPGPGMESIVDVAAGTSGVACFNHVDGVAQRIVLGETFEVGP
ncbi:MAG TPA: nucleoside hydrolase [Candidatus Limnocylindria bacterium]